MIKETLQELEQFELFVEEMEKFVLDAKRKISAYIVPLEPHIDLDLRNGDGDVFFLPFDLKDYFPLWKYVKKCQQEYLSEKDNNPHVWNEISFDLYYNDPKDYSAYFQDMTLWVIFEDEKIITKRY